jgi:hypothetical protein
MQTTDEAIPVVSSPRPEPESRLSARPYVGYSIMRLIAQQELHINDEPQLCGFDRSTMRATKHLLLTPARTSKLSPFQVPMVPVSPSFFVNSYIRFVDTKLHRSYL